MNCNNLQQVKKMCNKFCGRTFLADKKGRLAVHFSSAHDHCKKWGMSSHTEPDEIIAAIEMDS